MDLEQQKQAQLMQALQRFQDHQKDMMTRHGIQQEPEMEQRTPASVPSASLSEQDALRKVDTALQPEIEHFRRLSQSMNR